MKKYSQEEVEDILNEMFSRLQIVRHLGITRLNPAADESLKGIEKQPMQQPTPESEDTIGMTVLLWLSSVVGIMWLLCHVLSRNPRRKRLTQPL